MADSFLMAVEFLKYQGEVAYEISKKQAIAITSTSSTIGIGWSSFLLRNCPGILAHVEALA